MKLDPVLLEILGHQFKAIAEEMGIALSRTARTTYVKEAADFGTALATPGGKFFAYPTALGVSGFLDLDAGKTLAAVDDLAPGDVIITNHPYESGGLSTHMPDLQLVRPYFHDGHIVAAGWSFVHTADIGGMVPSSIAPDLDELYQEGLIIPPLKIVEQGVLNDDFLTLYRSNCRMPEPNIGDIKAMLVALETGARRVDELIAAHGIGTFMTAQKDLVDYACTKAREVQRRLPDGVYEFWDFMDDDYVSRHPIRVRCRMTVDDGMIHLDFAGSDPQVAAAYNVPTGGVRHPWLTLRLMQMVASIDNSVPLNYGLFENITVSVPKGSLLNPEQPAAVGIRSAAAIRVNDVLTGCIAKAAPELIPAPSGGTVVPTVLAEFDPKKGTRRVHVMQSLIGGTGARLGADGVDGRDSSLANCFNTPTETTESEVGVIIEEYGLRPNSGGPGKWRGGTGLIFSVRILKSGSAVLGRGLERYLFRPWGIQGGMPGAPARVVLNMGTPNERELGKISMVEPEAGDVVTLMSAGGGGYGDPFERPAQAVLRDVRAGFVDACSAFEDYGVIIADDRVDEAATAQLRQGSRAERPAFDFGPEREAFEAVFDDVRLSRLVETLMPLPAALRTKRRHDIYDNVLPDLPKLPAQPEAARSKLDHLLTQAGMAAASSSTSANSL